MLNLFQLGFILLNKKFLQKKLFLAKNFFFFTKFKPKTMKILYGKKNVKKFGHKFFISRNNLKLSFCFINTNKRCKIANNQNKDNQYYDKIENFKTNQLFDTDIKKLKISDSLIDKPNFRTKMSNISLIDEETRSKTDQFIKNYIIKMLNYKKKKK